MSEETQDRSADSQRVLDHVKKLLTACCAGKTPVDASAAWYHANAISDEYEGLERKHASLLSENARLKERVAFLEMVGPNQCPACRQDMGFAHHGRCTRCGKECGCSFNATSSSDFCRPPRDAHFPGMRAKPPAA